MTGEYTPEQTPPRQCPECGGLSGHTGDCVYRPADLPPGTVLDGPSFGDYWPPEDQS